MRSKDLRSNLLTVWLLLMFFPYLLALTKFEARQRRRSSTIQPLPRPEHLSREQQKKIIRHLVDEGMRWKPTYLIAQKMKADEKLKANHSRRSQHHEIRTRSRVKTPTHEMLRVVTNLPKSLGIAFCWISTN